MTTKTNSKWAFPESKIRSITRSVKSVLESHDMWKLTKVAYEFIILKHGFIAHYDLGGFCATYENDIDGFANNLLHGEGYGYDNLREADRQENDAQFNEWYGAEYCKGSGRTMREICTIAERFINPLGLKL